MRVAQGLHGASLPNPPRSGPLRRPRHVQLWVTAAWRLWRFTIRRHCPRARVARGLHLRDFLKGR